MVLTDEMTLVSANWSGPTVGGLAEGQGNLQFIYKDKSGKETKVQADAEMKAGKLDGHVSIKWSDGDSFDGNYRDGQREGRGIFKYVAGDVYNGEWKADKIEGKGIYKWTDGEVYDGEWKAGKGEGRGVMKSASGGVYDGEFKDGQKNGKGVYKFADGRVYEGEYKNDKPDGYGIGKEANGKVAHDGQWKNGEPVTDGQAGGTSAGGALKADKVLGIPWGATDEQAKSIMNQRPKTQSYSFLNGKDAFDRWQGYSGPFADFDAVINIHFYKDKMWMVSICVWVKEIQIVEMFNTLKQGLAERYGAPQT